MTIGLGVVGTGIFATDSHLPAIQQTQGIKVVAATNRTRSKAETFAESAGIPKTKVFDTIDELLADPEVTAVDALVPVEHNHELVKKVIAAGKPLALEKPLAGNLEDARAIVELTKATDLPIQVMENWIFHHETAKLKELLPKIGKTVSFLYSTTGPFGTNKYQQTSWRQKPKHIGGYLSDGGVHDMALITEVLGDVDNVAAHATQLRELSGDLDTMTSVVGLKSGVFGSFTYAKAFGAARKVISFQIFGTEGSIVLEAEAGQPSSLVIRVGAPKEEVKSERFEIEANKINGVVPEFESFVKAVEAKDKKLIVATPAKAFHHFAVIVACVTSAKKGGAQEKVATI